MNLAVVLQRNMTAQFTDLVDDWEQPERGIQSEGAFIEIPVRCRLRPSSTFLTVASYDAPMRTVRTYDPIRRIPRETRDERMGASDATLKGRRGDITTCGVVRGNGWGTLSGGSTRD